MGHLKISQLDDGEISIEILANLKEKGAPPKSRAQKFLTISSQFIKFTTNLSVIVAIIIGIQQAKQVTRTQKTQITLDLISRS